MTAKASYPRSNITGVILAGGQATRMGGQDKGLLNLGGEPLVAHAVRRLSPQVGPLLVNANRNIERYRQYATQIVRDGADEALAAGYLGPLAGMLAAIDAASTRYILTVPCDSPLLIPNYAARMYRVLRQHNAQLCVASDGKRLQPVFALIGTDLRDDLHAFLAAGERKIDRWYARHTTVTANFDDAPQMFRNINTPQELVALEAELTRINPT